ncbi:MAG: hypothetical protein M1495_07065 [Bacteroidetes bacterium]|nr:hypothetical protein [Bacteroidota bacterium]
MINYKLEMIRIPKCGQQSAFSELATAICPLRREERRAYFLQHTITQF